MSHQTVQLSAPSYAVKGIQKIMLEPEHADDLSTATITLYQRGLKRYISIPALHLHAHDVHTAIAVRMHIRWYVAMYYCDEFGQVHLKHKESVFVQKLLEMCLINEFEISRESLFIDNWNQVLNTGIDADLTPEEQTHYCEVDSIVHV